MFSRQPLVQNQCGQAGTLGRFKEIKREDLSYIQRNKGERSFQNCVAHHIWQIDFKTLQHSEPLNMSEDLGPRLLPDPATGRCHLW